MISHTFGDSCVGKMRKSDSADIVWEALWIQSVLGLLGGRVVTGLGNLPKFYHFFSASLSK